jgi:8-hydroxy-5-deazaflavin:NADPH oxidoreductase
LDLPWVKLKNKAVNKDKSIFVSPGKLRNISSLKIIHMRVGIIGSGAVAQTLGRAFLTEGYEVMLGSRDPLKEAITKWKAVNPGANSGTFAEAASFGELLVLATAGYAAVQALQASGLKNLEEKTIIDVTNPIAPVPPDKGVLKFTTTLDHSLMEQLQLLAPRAKFVKAFNSVGNSLMYKPSFKEGKPSMFICGNDEAAKKQVTEILDRFGWETEDMGGVEAARAIEPLCMLWCIPGFLRNQWTHAFKLLK